jgi:L-fuconolactonase
MNNPPQPSPSSKPIISPLTLRIDAHHHLWRYDAAEFSWIDDNMATLRRDFLTDEFWPELQKAQIDATVVVQARESLEETNWLLKCARSTPFIRGVVGWAPLEAEDFPEILSRLGDTDRLIGFREIVQTKPDGYLDGPAFNRGIRHLTDLNLTYDILIQERQLVEAARFVDRHPYQRFVLDHAAKPNISKSELEPWKTHLRDLAHRPNVSCKISGLVTEANWQHWTVETLRPYVDICVEAFGTDRLLAGSDWPVCLVASTYVRWWDVLALHFASYTGAEVRRIFGGNAIDFYQLSV